MTVGTVFLCAPGRINVQLYLNGFYPGDPALTPQDPRRRERTTEFPAEVDVLIVGCGPAGLVLAAQLAAFPGIETRIVEQKPGPIELGQADGVACRSVEMFDAFGFSDRLLKEACWINETVFWRPDEADSTQIVRSGRIQDVEDGLSEFPHVVLNQARVHNFLLESMWKSPSRLVPDYGLEVTGLEIDHAQERPVNVTLRTADALSPAEEFTVRARYVVGCDGAHSTVRRSIGRPLHGDSANQEWGVMDVLAITDFPDIRYKGVIQSADEGNIIIIPREGGHLVRFYIELDELAPGQRVSRESTSVNTLIAAAKRILRPYTLDVQEVVWWSVYEIGQRLTDKFDDVNTSKDHDPRVFIAGDACHTHSPKAGQGMNVSMQDAFNLGWKLAAVLEGRADPSLLHTYSSERQALAQGLIDFDREWSSMISAKPLASPDSGEDGVDPSELQQYYAAQGRYTAGVATRYEPSPITGSQVYQGLASGFPIGERFHSAPVIRLSDAKPMQLGHVARADGRWRLYLFADRRNPSDPASRLSALCDFLEISDFSPVRRFTPEGADIDFVFDVRAIFQQAHPDLEPTCLPPLLLPQKGRYGLKDYEKCFAPDLKSGRDVFDLRGVNRDEGCVVIVRPDQYVSHVLPLDGHKQLTGYFSSFMIETAILTENLHE